ncbi:MAG: hypothetical protein QW223_08085 [Candidatus Caldarchaeum sp.]
MQSNAGVLVYYRDDKESMETHVIDIDRRTIRPIDAYIPLKIQSNSDGKVQWASLPYSSLLRFSGKIIRETHRKDGKKKIVRYFLVGLGGELENLDFIRYKDRYGSSDVIDLGSKVVSVYKNWVRVEGGEV